MDYSRYEDDQRSLYSPARKHIEGGLKEVKEFVKFVRQCSPNENLELYYDTFPFALEYGKPLKQFDEETGDRDRADYISGLLSNIGRGETPGYIPVFLAWLWYRHEDKAKQKYEQLGLLAHPYEGHPNPRICPQYIAEKFELRNEIDPSDKSGLAEHPLSDQSTPEPPSHPLDERGIDNDTEIGSATKNNMFRRIIASPEFMASFAISGVLVLTAYWLNLFAV